MKTMKAVRSNFVPFERNQLRFASRFGAFCGRESCGIKNDFQYYSDPEKNNLL